MSQNPPGNASNETPKKKGYGGRRKKPEEQIKSKCLSFLVTRSEDKKVKELYKKSGQRTLSQFLYQSIINGKIVVYEQKVLHPDLHKEVKKIGVNINQIAFNLNQNKGSNLSSAMQNDLKEVAFMLQELLKKTSS